MENKNNIREMRKRRGMSGADLAELLGISTQYLYDIERGKRRLSAEILSKLSDIFGSSTDYILGISEVNTHENSPDFHEESELADIPIEKLNEYKLTYKGYELSKDEADDIIQLLEAALKRWKK